MRPVAAQSFALIWVPFKAWTGATVHATSDRFRMFGKGRFDRQRHYKKTPRRVHHCA